MHSSSVVTIRLFLLLVLLLFVVYESEQASNEHSGEMLSSKIVSAIVSGSQNSKSQNGRNNDVIVIDRINGNDVIMIDRINGEISTVKPHEISLLLKDDDRSKSTDESTDLISKYRQHISDRSRRHLGNSSKRKWRLPRADPDTSTEQSTGQPAAASPPVDDGDDGSSSSSIWKKHRWLFIAIIIFICVSLVLAFVYCICLRCRKRTTTKQPEEVKDGPKLTFGPSGPMKEFSAANEPPPIDEENGWIIPLDQMTKEELDQPEVQVSRL